MNIYQKHALNLLQTLVFSAENTNSMRSEKLLCRLEPLIEYANITQEDFCKDWTYNLGTCFSDTLDCKLQQRTRNKEKYWLWTQGSNFDFKQGYTIHKADGSLAIQIEIATPAVKSKDEQRDPGLVVLKTYAATHRNPAFIPQELHRTTQDGFIAFLITGQIYKNHYE